MCCEGTFSDPDIIVGKIEFFKTPGSPLHNYVTKHFPLDQNCYVELVNYKGTLYTVHNNHSILLYAEDKKKFFVGMIRKIVIQTTDEGEQRVLFSTALNKKIAYLPVFF